MIKLLSHASDLKYDNPLLKAGSRAHRLCNFCNTNSEDNVKHMIMQCADTHEERSIMVQCIVDAVGDEAYMVQRVHKLFPIFIGGRVENMSDDNMLKLWMVAGHHIHNMYKRRTREPEGIR